MHPKKTCPECEGGGALSRRDFVRVASLGAAVAAAGGSTLRAAENSTDKQPESLVKTLYDSFTPEQKKELCFDWDHKEEDRGLLRTFVSNNWNVVEPELYNVGGKFFTSDQQDLIRTIFLGLYNKDWHESLLKQLQDDAGGYGKSQTIALFGTPGSGKFQLLMTGRHLTIRCDGDSAEHVAFGGPIFYGHAASGFNEMAGHPDNVYWHQAVKANGIFKMLDGKQREKALLLKSPAEKDVGFRGHKDIPGLPVSELSKDQKQHAQEVLKALVAPYRVADQSEVAKCLEAQGGLDQCRLTFYRQTDEGNPADLGDDGVWDVWRLEGPSFVWHFRGVPHVHVWVNVANDPSPVLNSRG